MLPHSSPWGMGDGQKTPFWEASCLDGSKPKEIARLIFAASKRKKWNVKSHNDYWIRKVMLDENFTMSYANNLWIFRLS
jgi:hypothetical protein